MASSLSSMTSALASSIRFSLNSADAQTEGHDCQQQGDHRREPEGQAAASVGARREAMSVNMGSLVRVLGREGLSRARLLSKRTDAQLETQLEP